MVSTGRMRARASLASFASSWPFVDLAFQEARDALASPLGRTVQRVVDEDAEAGLGGDLDDARAHRAGAEDADGVDVVHRPLNRGSRFSPKAATPSA